MERRIVEAIVTGSRPFPAYGGGVQLGDAVLEELAAALRAGQLPVFINHDIRRPMDAKILDAEVRPTADGFKEVWVRIDVDAGQWDAFDQQRIAAGAPGGFSFSAAQPVRVLDGLPSASTEVIELAADASHWPDEVLLAAAEDLRQIGTVDVGRRFAFAYDPAAVVVISIALNLVLTVVGNALYDALKRFLFTDRPTIFHFRVERGDELVEARLETSASDTLRQAVDAFDELVNPGRLFVWDEESGEWKPL